MERHLDLLTKVSLLPVFDDKIKEFSQFKSYGVYKKYDKGSTILDQEEICNSLYYLETGKIKVIMFTTSGEEKLFWYCYEGSFVGDVPFFHAMPSNAAIIADEDTALYVYNREAVERMLQEKPDFSKYLFKSMAKKIRLLVGQLQDSIFSDPVARISKFLYLLAVKYGQTSQGVMEINLNITHKDIGSITGLHRVTVTNVLGKLKKENIISKNKSGNLVIKSQEKLYIYGFGNE